MNDAEIFLDAGQVAQYLKLSIATIRKWVLIKFIPYKKIGRAVRFSAAEIQEWMETKSHVPKQTQKKGGEGGGE